jgi:hypothetical protein
MIHRNFKKEKEYKELKNRRVSIKVNVVCSTFACVVTIIIKYMYVAVACVAVPSIPSVFFHFFPPTTSLLHVKAIVSRFNTFLFQRNASRNNIRYFQVSNIACHYRVQEDFFGHEEIMNMNQLPRSLFF